MVDQIKNGVSPRNVAIDTQYNAFKSGRNAGTFDGIGVQAIGSWPAPSCLSSGIHPGIDT